MTIKEINNKEEWENFLSYVEEKTFLQSWNWGEFQKKLGNKIWRFGIFDNGNLIAEFLLVKIVAKRGRFLFIPHGPLLKEEGGKLEILKTILEKLKEISAKEEIDFIRIAPLWERNEENKKIFKELGFKKAPIHMHPELSWVLNITKSEEELLMGMRKTTRYLIRQALKNNKIEVIKSNNKDDIQRFYDLYEITRKRQHFVPFSQSYIEKEFESFISDNEIMIFLGKYKGDIVSGAIVIFWQDSAFYHHGASSLKYPKVPVSYLLQWEIIKEAKRRKLKKYNFWGIADIKGEHNSKNRELMNHPWRGLTIFKMGFGGEKKPYVKTQDLPLSWKYWFNWVVETLRRKKRGF